jgi:hypothetical protein
MLTPGLTVNQAFSLDEYLRRLSGLPPAAAVPLYQDADLVAGRILSTRASVDLERASDTIAALRDVHPQPVAIVAYVTGLAFGVRLGKTFSAPPKRRSKWISEEYKRLSEPSRRQVQRLIRMLLKAQEPALFNKRRDPQEDVADARRWIQAAGKQARALR